MVLQTVISALRKLKQRDLHEFEASLGNKVPGQPRIIKTLSQKTNKKKHLKLGK